MSWKKVKLGTVLEQYRIEHWVQNDKIYKQVSILNDGSVVLRGEKTGKEIGRKRQFIIDLNKYPNTLIFTRQLLLQGSIGMASKDVNGCIVTENMPMFSVTGIEPEFLFIFLKSELFKSQVRGLKTSGTAQKSLHERQFLELEIPLPTLLEQIQIVEEVQAQQQKLEIVNKEIEAQQSYLQLLRQTILQEAVQGKLTQQSPQDEPATELLKRIKAEKQKLIKAGKLKKEKELPPITEDEIPFKLPEGWVWCRLGEVGQINPRNVFDDEKDVSFIPMTLISSEFGIAPQHEKRKWKDVKSSFTHFAENDVAVAKITPCFENSKAAIFKGLINGIGAGTTELHIFRGNVKDILPDYVYLFFKSPDFLKNGESKMTGSAGQKRVPSDYIKNCLFPFPPFAVQQLIVAKVKQLQQQLSQLEAQVQQSRQYAQQLLQSVLKEAFEEKGKVYEMEEGKAWMVAEE